MAKLTHPSSPPCNKIKLAQKLTNPQKLGVAASIIIVNLLNNPTLIFPVSIRGVQWSGRRHGSRCATTDDSSCVRCVSIAVFDLVLTENVGYCYILGHKQREVVHSTTSREGSTVEMFVCI